MAKVLKNILSDYGYNLVALPKEDISPLMLLYKNDQSVSSVESTVDNLFAIADAPLPVVTKNKTVTNIDGNASVIFDSEGGISMLDWLLKTLKMGKFSAKTEIDATHKVKITYENVKEDKVDLLALDNFISGSDPVEGKFNSFKEKLKDSELYVINNILKSNSFSIAVEDSNGTKVDIDATIKGIVDANVNISRNKNNDITLKNTNSDTYIVFAFKSQQIKYDQKKWWQLFKKNDAKFRIIDKQGVVLRSEDKYATQSLKMGNDEVNI
ncbi:MAG: hypothetical protein ABIN48_12740 [Ginsengibacter sp.]